MSAPAETKTTGPRACSTCAKAKARCVPCANPSKCERCDRLKKPCSQRAPAPPRPRKKQKTSRVALLEKRLEDLSSQLEASKGHPQNVLEWIRREKRRNMSYSHIFSPETEVQDGAITESLNDTTPVSTREEGPEVHPSPPTPDSSQTSLEDVWPAGAEAQMLLEKYMARVMHLFPFVVVPRGQSSEQLRAERPFMWKAVILQACDLDAQRQANLGLQLLKDLSEGFFMKPEKSADLLQGLLLYIAWFHCSLSSYQITNLVGLAKSICLSFIFEISRTELSEFRRIPGAVEKMRAYLGTYYLSTAVFTTSKRVDAFMDISYLDCVMQCLDKMNVHPTDKNVVQLVKIQMLAQSVVRTLSMPLITGGSLRECPQFLFVPLIMVVRNFQGQIEEYKNSLPEELKDNVHIMAHVHVTELLLFEVGLQETSTNFQSLQPADRLELLWFLLRSLKSLLSLNVSSCKREREPTSPGIFSIDFMYGFITCLKLISFQAPGWNSSYIRQDLAFVNLLDRRVQEIEDICVRSNLHKIAILGNVMSPTQQQQRQRQHPFHRVTEALRIVIAALKAVPDPVPTQVVPDTQTFTPPADGKTQSSQDELETGSHFWQYLLKDAQDGEAWNIDNTFPIGYPLEAQMMG